MTLDKQSVTLGTRERERKEKQTLTNKQDRKDLKIQSYRERVSKLTLSYEEEVADLRVELTVTSQERDDLRKEVEELKSRLEPADEIVEGELVQEDDKE